MKPYDYSSAETLIFGVITHTHTPIQCPHYSCTLFLTYTLTLHIVDLNTIKARASLACLGRYPVYSCLSVRLHSGECQLSNCCSRWWILVAVLTASCATPVPSVHCGGPQQAHTYSHADTHATKIHKHMLLTHMRKVTHTPLGHLQSSIWWMVLRGDRFTSERTLSFYLFFLLPLLPGYCVHIQMRYWVENHTNLRIGDIWH